MFCALKNMKSVLVVKLFYIYTHTVYEVDEKTFNGPLPLFSILGLAPHLCFKFSLYPQKRSLKVRAWIHTEVSEIIESIYIYIYLV